MYTNDLSTGLVGKYSVKHQKNFIPPTLPQTNFVGFKVQRLMKIYLNNRNLCLSIFTYIHKCSFTVSYCDCISNLFL